MTTPVDVPSTNVKPTLPESQGRRPCSKRHTLTPSTCRLCWLAENVRHYQRKWGFPETGKYEHPPETKSTSFRPGLPVRTSLPLCEYEGSVVESCKTCNSGQRDVRLCLHPTADRDFCTRGRVSDKVQSCMDCTDHSHRPKPQSGWVYVPYPPELKLQPRKKYALVTVVVGEEGERLHASSGPAMRAYADRMGVDIVVLRWPGHPDWPMSAKFGIGRVLDHYERIAYVDADVLLRKSSVNLFDMCNPDEMGVVDELQFHRMQPKLGREVAYQQFRKDMGFQTVRHLPWYFNAGVMVVPRSHSSLLLPPPIPMPTLHCAEQDHTNAMLLDSGMKYRLMDRRANWQNWTDHEFRSAPTDAILHWSGAGHGRRDRAKEIANKLYDSLR